jgi:multimeric flavodoxin WrbA
VEGKLKVIALQGSPRKDGNTELLLDAAVRGAQEQGAEITVYRLNSLRLTPCQNCGGCDEAATCVIADDMQTILRDIRTTDRIILASPIFFFSVSAQTKIVIDRCQAFWAEKYLQKRPVPPGRFGRKGLLLLVGGMKMNAKNAGFACAEATARAFFRTVSVKEHTTLSYDGIDAKGAIREHPTALADAFTAGKVLAAAGEVK